jgi:rod shape-determining protein MreD
MKSSIYVAIPLMALLAILQAGVLEQFPILGLTPQLPFLAALAWGLLHDVEEGALWAFTAGFFADLLSLTPMGVSSLAWLTAVSLAVFIARRFPTSRFLIPMLMGGLASLIALLLSVLLLWITGYQPAPAGLTGLPPLAVLHTLLILPIYWLTYTIEQTVRPRQVEI